MIDFFKSRVFLINLLIAILVIILVLWISFKWVSAYTLHGETIIVPVLKGKTIAEVEEITQGNKLRYVIVDSLYDSKKKRGTVLEQNPPASMQVKENRTVYLTINALNPPKIKMPNLIDVSLRQATAMLETYGLTVGRISYEPDFAKNAVLKQLHNNEIIKPGEQISRGSRIDLVLGDGLSNEKVSVPSVVGLTRSEAIRAIVSSSLNVGAEVPDATVKDSSSAFVYKQYPLPTGSNVAAKGSSVDIFLTQDKSKLTSEEP